MNGLSAFQRHYALISRYSRLMGPHLWTPSPCWYPFVPPCFVDNFLQLTLLSIVIYSRYFAQPAKLEFSLCLVYRLTLPQPDWLSVVKFPIFTSLVCSKLIYHSKSALQTKKRHLSNGGVNKDLVRSFQERPQWTSSFDIHILVWFPTTLCQGWSAWPQNMAKVMERRFQG